MTRFVRHIIVEVFARVRSQLSLWSSLSAAVVVGCALIGWIGGRHVHRVLPVATAEGTTLQITGIRSGEELLLVFIGSSSCPAAREKGFDKVVAQVTERMRHEADRRKALFGRIGVALDWQIADGLTFLDKFGKFDEVIVGRDWLNTGYDKYVRNVRGDDGVPAIAVVSRQIVKRDSAISFANEVVLASVRGTIAIRKWLTEGAQLTSRYPANAGRD